MSYPKPIPVDINKSPMQAYPPALKAIQTFGIANQAASSVITFNDAVTEIEITAGNAPVAIRWIPTTDTAASVIAYGATANFDHIIPTNVTRPFVVPKEGLSVASNVGINIQQGLYRRLAWITAGTSSSIMATTF